MKRKGKLIDQQQTWLKAVEESNVSKVITVGESDHHSDNMLIGYNDLLETSTETYCDTEVMDSEDPLFILYTSGTTGSPKGTIHVHGGFMVVAAQQTAYTIDLFWYADIGWITGQTWVVYGSPIVGGMALIYDGALTYPQPYTWCDLISRHKVSIFGASPHSYKVLYE